jgi:type IV pilus assembly protein PilX
MEYMKQQQGIVLVTAMIMIVAVTSIAVTLMSSSSIDLKITNAAQEREQAESLLMGEVQRVIQTQSLMPSGSNHFLMSPEQLSLPANQTFAGQHNTTNTMRALNNGAMQLNCPRSFKFTKGVMCNLTEVSTSVEYGTRTRHQLTVVVGVGQQYIDQNQGK